MERGEGAGNIDASLAGRRPHCCSLMRSLKLWHRLQTDFGLLARDTCEALGLAQGASHTEGWQPFSPRPRGQSCGPYQPGDHEHQIRRVAPAPLCSKLTA
jgi:hypothetical protein